MEIYQIEQTDGEIKFLKTNASRLVMTTLVDAYNRIDKPRISFQEFMERNGISGIYITTSYFKLEKGIGVD